ncbi:MAG: hypothetical protein LBQ60_21980 [Bacteroidales bacterium]|jgi:hypothetical protein|nr:hypothetical protein [Bacteroidales bacterium]
MESKGQFPGIPVITTPKPATLQPNVIIGNSPQPAVSYPQGHHHYLPDTRQRNEQIIEEARQHELQRQNRQKQLQEAIADFEPQRGLNFVNCRNAIPLPDFRRADGVENFHRAFDGIEKMLTGEAPVSIKDAVFMAENTFYGNSLNYDDYDQSIRRDVELCNARIRQLKLNEDDPMVKAMMLFHFLTDTFEVQLSAHEKTLVHYPMTYDYNDPGGKEDITKVFVTKLMTENTGQCNSMPKRFLIMAEEMGFEAHFATAPLHSFVKIQDPLGTWHNLELTCGAILSDQHYMYGGFIKSEALRKNIYLYPMTKKELLADILLDLALIYRHTYGCDRFFAMCYNTALEFDPKNIRANIFKGIYAQYILSYICAHTGVETPDDMEDCPAAKRAWQLYRKVEDEIYARGFEPMPQELYQLWLKHVSEEKAKSGNQNMKMQYLVK